MKANQLIARFIKVLDNLDKNNIRVPGLIISHAGFGKTSTVKKYCEYMDYNLITLIPSMYSSDDILGLQSIKDGNLVRLTPSWFNRMKDIISNGKRTILFIDEITTCDPYIQGPLLDLIFNGNLGEEHIPNNVFIIAAGNYAEDLNNVFKMSDPLINRFVLLNLNNNDFNIEELLNSDFDSLKGEDLEDLLKIQKEDTLINDFNLFKKWVSEEGEISFGKTNSSNLDNIGLVGFTSVRSLNNSLRFIEEYFQNYNDDSWIRIVGDTLGTSNSKEGSPLRFIIKAAANGNFFKKVNIKDDSETSDFSDLISLILNNVKISGPSEKSLKDLDDLINEDSIMNLTEAKISDINSLASACMRVPGNEAIYKSAVSILNKIDKAISNIL